MFTSFQHLTIILTPFYGPATRVNSTIFISYDFGKHLFSKRGRVCFGSNAMYAVTSWSTGLQSWLFNYWGAVFSVISDHCCGAPNNNDYWNSTFCLHREPVNRRWNYKSECRVYRAIYKKKYHVFVYTDA